MQRYSNDACCLTNKRENLGHCGFNGITKVLTFEEAFYLILIRLHPFRDVICYVIGVCCVVNPTHKYVLQSVKLRYHRRKMR